MSDTLHKIKDTLVGAALCFLLGAMAVYLAIAQPAPGPGPAPVPQPQPAPIVKPVPVVKHTPGTCISPTSSPATGRPLPQPSATAWPRSTGTRWTPRFGPTPTARRS